MLDPDQLAGWIQNMGNDSYKCREGSGTAPMRDALSTFITGDTFSCDDIIERSAAVDRCIDSLLAMTPPLSAEQRSRLAMLKGFIPLRCPVVYSHAGKCPANTVQTGSTSRLECAFARPIAEVGHPGGNPIGKASCELEFVDYVCTCTSSGITQVRCGPGASSAKAGPYAQECGEALPDDADFREGLDDSCITAGYLLDLAGGVLSVDETIRIDPKHVSYTDVANGNQQAIDQLCLDLIETREAAYYNQRCDDDPRSPTNEVEGTRILNVPCCR
jgi:hypothetical protein